MDQMVKHLRLSEKPSKTQYFHSSKAGRALRAAGCPAEQIVETHCILECHVRDLVRRRFNATELKT